MLTCNFKLASSTNVFGQARAISSLADDLACAFDQCGQDVEGAGAEPHWLVAFEQEPLCCEEPVRTKRDRASVHGVASGFSILFTQFYLVGPEIARAQGQCCSMARKPAPRSLCRYTA